MNDKRIKRVLPPEEIIRMRIEGKSNTTIAEASGVSKSRIGQIVRGCVPRRPKVFRVFTGVELDGAVKDALRVYVNSHGTSMSAFIAEAVEEKLKALNVEIARQPVYTGELLPL